ADDLVHAGESGKLVGDDAVEALSGDNARGELLQSVPVVVDVGDHADFLGPEVLGDLDRLIAEGRVQGIGEAVGNVGAGDEGPVAQLGAAQRRRRGNRRLADTAFAQIEDYAHLLLQSVRKKCVIEVYHHPLRARSAAVVGRCGKIENQIGPRNS